METEAGDFVNGFPVHNAGSFDLDSDSDDESDDDAPLKGNPYTKGMPIYSACMKNIKTNGEFKLFMKRMKEAQQEVMTLAASRATVQQEVSSNNVMLSLPEVDNRQYDYRERQFCSPENKRSRYSYNN